MKLRLIILFFYLSLSNFSVNSDYLLLEEKETDIDTFCSHFHSELFIKFQKNKNFDVYSAWDENKLTCKKTKEYELFLANLKYISGEKNVAEKSLKAFLKEKDVSENMKRFAYMILYFALFEQDKNNEAEELCKKIIEKYPTWGRAYLFYANLELYRNNFKQAELYAKKAINLNSSLTEGYVILSAVEHFEHHNPKAAIKNYKLAISKGIYYWLFRIPHATYAAVYSAMNQKNYKLAKWILVKQIEFYPEQAKKQWYIDLANKVKIYFQEHAMDPTKTFTDEEVEGLSSGKITILDIIGND